MVTSLVFVMNCLRDTSSSVLAGVPLMVSEISSYFSQILDRKENSFRMFSIQNELRGGKSFLLPLVKLPVLLRFEGADLVPQCLSVAVQHIIYLASMQTKQGQGHCDVQGGELPLQGDHVLDFLKILTRGVRGIETA